MARRNWIRCECGAKLRVKSVERICYSCKQKQRKA